MLKATASTTVGEAGPTARSGGLRSVLDFRCLALLTSLATYALIVLGGTVRATDSGLACPDWPLCHGQLIPPAETKVLIEYSHRLVAASVGFLILGTALAAWLAYRHNRLVVRGAAAAVVLLIAQVLVGGVTVNMELPDTVVAVHLSIALILLAALILVTAGAFWARRAGAVSGPLPADRPKERAFLVLAAAAALATFVLIIIGSYVANSGAALVYPDWPLFDGKLISAGGRLANLHYAHRLMAVVVGLLILAVAVSASGGFGKERRPVLVAAAAVACVLFVAQVLVGAANIWLDLADSVRIAHLALASALWGMMVLTVVWGYLERRPA